MNLNISTKQNLIDFYTLGLSINTKTRLLLVYLKKTEDKGCKVRHHIVTGKWTLEQFLKKLQFDDNLISKTKDGLYHIVNAELLIHPLEFDDDFPYLINIRRICEDKINAK